MCIIMYRAPAYVRVLKHTMYGATAASRKSTVTRSLHRPSDKGDPITQDLNFRELSLLTGSPNAPSRRQLKHAFCYIPLENPPILVQCFYF